MLFHMNSDDNNVDQMQAEDKNDSTLGCIKRENTFDKVPRGCYFTVLLVMLCKLTQVRLNTNANLPHCVCAVSMWMANVVCSLINMQYTGALPTIPTTAFGNYYLINNFNGSTNLVIIQRLFLSI